MGSLRFPGFGERLSAALVAAGYVKTSGQPDVATFLHAHAYDPRSFYPWIRGQRTPELDTLTRLAGILGVTRAWLLLGDGVGPQSPQRAHAPLRGVERRSPATRGRGAGRNPSYRTSMAPLWGWLTGSDLLACPA